MYQLLVFYPGESNPRHLASLFRSGEILTALTEQLGAHLACDRIEISMDGAKLFTVDSRGVRRP
ncbi:hypothetical protein [Caulobacter segnis]